MVNNLFFFNFIISSFALCLRSSFFLAHLSYGVFFCRASVFSSRAFSPLAIAGAIATAAAAAAATAAATESIGCLRESLHPGVCWPQEEGQILSISVDFPLLRFLRLSPRFLFSFPAFRADFLNQGTAFTPGTMLATRRRSDSKHFRGFSAASFSPLISSIPVFLSCFPC
jgi:hypothetical protein